MALIEGAAPAVLAAQANRNAILHKAGEGQCLGHSVIDYPRAGSHFGALLQQFRNLRMNVERRRKARQTLGELREFFTRNRSFDFVLCFITAAEIFVPIIRQSAEHWFLRMWPARFCASSSSALAASARERASCKSLSSA